MAESPAVPAVLQQLIHDLEVNKEQIEKQLGPHAKLVNQWKQVDTQLDELNDIVKKMQPRKRGPRKAKETAE